MLHVHTYNAEYIRERRGMGGITLPGGAYVMQEKDHLGRLPVIQHIIPRSRNV